MIGWLLNFLNPCVHQYETVATLKDDEEKPQAVKLVQACSVCGRIRETVIKAPGWCDHRWYEEQTVRVFNADDDDKAKARPMGICKIMKCEKCGDVKRVNLYEKLTLPADAIPRPVRTAG